MFEELLKPRSGTSSVRLPNKYDIDDVRLQSSSMYLANHKRVLQLRGQITPFPYRDDQFSPAMLQDDIFALNALDEKAPITLLIDSPGGDIATGFTLHDIIKSSPAPITCIAGNAASMATIILQAGVERLCFPHSLMMLHLPTSHVAGDIEDIKIRTKLIDTIKDQLVDVFLGRGVTTTLAENKRDKPDAVRKQLLKDMDREYWLHADEAVEYGLVDRICTPKDLFK